ncbi:hypothetical protein TNCV_3205701 [Trichonephila clavipes]|nr:hypothetical protein TNCV_3205701 [Trichonephila clavipes]
MPIQRLRHIGNRDCQLGNPRHLTMVQNYEPHELTAEDKSKRKAACLAYLRDQRKENILDRIVRPVMKNGCTKQYKAQVVSTQGIIRFGCKTIAN